MNHVEKIIVRKIAAALLTRGPVTVDGERGFDPDALTLNSVDAIMKEADQFDECWLFSGGSHAEGYGPFVYLIFGNGNGGWDVISDYSTALEPGPFKAVLDFIEAEGD